MLEERRFFEPRLGGLCCSSPVFQFGVRNTPILDFKIGGNTRVITIDGRGTTDCSRYDFGIVLFTWGVEFVVTILPLPE